MNRGRALCLYFTLCVPFGIAVHLGSELAGLGRDAGDLAFSPLHGYLLLLGSGALVAFLVAGGFFGGSAERRRRLGLMTASLPWGARGLRFAALSAAMQFAFFAVTQFGEGCPLCKGDLLVGLIAALIASGIGAFAVAALRRRIVRYFAPAFASRRPGARVAARARLRRSRPSFKFTYAGFAVMLGNRPPPFLLA
jgi:hypothetical protein